ncbi:hypothetical protein KGY64_02835 [Candidatus Bipolaricaulota bacterium]|nr:hypothetical protein [Candidatus Bipolaricaulota bacterium]
MGKIEDLEDFSPDDFNHLVRQAHEELDGMSGEASAVLDGEYEEDILDRHLSSEVEVGKASDLGRDEVRGNIAVGKSLEVIMRIQPTKAVEINGPRDFSTVYREAVKRAFKRIHGRSVNFTDVLT